MLASDDPGGGGWYNPAALGAIRRDSVQVGASAYALRHVTVEHALVTVLPWDTLDGGASTTGYQSVPSVLAFSYRLRDGLGLSVGVWAPHHASFTTTLGGASAGPYPGFPGIDTTYRQAYLFSSQASDTWAGVGVGWQARAGLRLGASVQGAYSTSSQAIELESALRTSSTDPLEQGAHVNVSVRSSQASVGARAVVGLQWDVTDALRLGLAVRSPQLRVTAWGQYARSAAVAALLPGFAPQEGERLEVLRPSSGASISEVGRIQLGLSLGRGPWVLRADGDWGPALRRQAGSSRATVNVRLGATYQVGPDLRCGVGLFREEASGRAADGLVAVDAAGVSAGLEVRPARVVRALGGEDRWDMLSGVVARATFGAGRGPGMTVVPFALGESVLPIFPGNERQGFQEVPARTYDLTLQVFTTLRF